MLSCATRLAHPRLTVCSRCDLRFLPAVDNENLNIVEMFTRAVMSAHSGGFSFGDPAPYIAVNHAEAAVRAMHDSSVDGVDGCLGCYPPVFGDVALKVGCETHTASQIVQEQLNLDGDVIAVGDEAFLE